MADTISFLLQSRSLLILGSRSFTDRVNTTDRSRALHGTVMSYCRQSQPSLHDTPYYHCVARCVRRAWPWGVDEYAGKAARALPCAPHHSYVHVQQIIRTARIG